MNRTGGTGPGGWNRTGGTGPGILDMAMDSPWQWTWPWTVHGHGHGHGRSMAMDMAMDGSPGIPGPGTLENQ